MPSRTDKPLKVFSAVVALIFSVSGISSASGPLIAGKYIEINGPATVSLSDIASQKTVAIDQKTIIHLPPSVKNILVENHTYSAGILTDELRAYTVQQAIFWVVATLALGSAVARR